jgi:hypothetical protein
MGHSDFILFSILWSRDITQKKNPTKYPYVVAKRCNSEKRTRNKMPSRSREIQLRKKSLSRGHEI